MNRTGMQKRRVVDLRRRKKRGGEGQIKLEVFNKLFSEIEL